MSTEVTTYLSAVVGVVNALPLPLRLACYTAVSLGAVLMLQVMWFGSKHQWRIPGPRLFVPIIGGIVEMIRDPFGYWDTVEKRSHSHPRGLSWTTIMSQFVVFATHPDVVHKIFHTNSADTLTVVLHPNGRIILGDNNIAFQTGPKHKALRASFLHLFTVRALGFYLKIQEATIRKHLKQWVEKTEKAGGFDAAKPEEVRNMVRDMNLETSQTVFLGPYLRDRERFNENYLLMTNGFLAAPIYFPGTGLYKAVQARKLVIEDLRVAAAESKRYMATEGAEPRCLMDYWAAHINEACAKAKEHDEEPPHYADDHMMGDAMMDFLFASQDASTASITWLIALMADNPDMMQRVVEEQNKLRPGDEPLTYENVNEGMVYAKQVVLEILRYKPAAPMVPMMAHSDFQITPDFVAPKGTLVIPSLVGAAKHGFPEPEKFDPDRMGPERQEDVKHAKGFIPFGVGPHRCVGYNYATQHLIAFMAVAARSVEWKRKKTSESDKTIYLPTLYPGDCLCSWKAKDV